MGFPLLLDPLDSLLFSSASAFTEVETAQVL